MVTKTIVTVLFNRDENELGAFERLYLDSIVRHCGSDTQLILVENYSPKRAETLRLLDGWESQLKARLGDIRVVYNTRNLGFAAANNQGLVAAEGETIFMINPDVRITESALDSMAEKLQRNEEYGIVGPLTPNPREGAQRIFFDVLNSYSDEELRRIDEFAERVRATYPDKERIVNSLSASSWGLRSGLVQHIGFLDKRFYPAYWEDLDYAVRAKNAGYKLIVDPQTFVYHGKVQNFGYGRVFLDHFKPSFFMNMGRFLIKHGPTEVMKEVSNWYVGLFKGKNVKL